MNEVRFGDLADDQVALFGRFCPESGKICIRDQLGSSGLGQIACQGPTEVIHERKMFGIFTVDTREEVCTRREIKPQDLVADYIDSN